MTIFTQECRPIDDCFRRGIVNCTTHHLRARGMFRQHLLGPVGRNNYMIFDDTDNVGARNVEGHGPHLGYGYVLCNWNDDRLRKMLPQRCAHRFAHTLNHQHFKRQVAALGI